MQEKGITIKIDDQLHKDIKLYCIQNDLTLKEFVMMAIAEFIKNYNEMEEKNDVEK